MYKIVFPWSSCSSCIHLVVLLHFACGMWFLVKWIEHFVTRFCWRGYTICMCPLEHLLKGSWHPLKYKNLGFIPLSTILCSKVRPSRSWGLDWKLCRSVKILSAHLQQIHTLRFCKWQKTAIETKTHRTIVQSISHPFFCNSRTCSSSTETIWRVNCNPANLLQLQHYRRSFPFSHIFDHAIFDQVGIVSQKKQLCPPSNSTYILKFLQLWLKFLVVCSCSTWTSI